MLDAVIRFSLRYRFLVVVISLILLVYGSYLATRNGSAAENEWNVKVEFTEDIARDWPELGQEFQIRHLANATDPNSRTFDFFIPLTNQFRVYEKNN